MMHWDFLIIQSFKDSFAVIFPGPLWIVLVGDADGFVPLTFKPKEELTVRNGKRKTPLRTPDTSCPSSPTPISNPNPSTETST